MYQEPTVRWHGWLRCREEGEKDVQLGSVLLFLSSLTLSLGNLQSMSDFVMDGGMPVAKDCGKMDEHEIKIFGI